VVAALHDEPVLRGIATEREDASGTKTELPKEPCARLLAWSEGIAPTALVTGSQPDPV
jgi:hypothetical protein